MGQTLSHSFTMIRIIAALALVAIPMASCDGILARVEELAIKHCDTEAPKGCLTWNEATTCVDKFHAYLEQFGIPPPSKAMFTAMAHTEDGVKCLSFDDWKNAQSQ